MSGRQANAWNGLLCINKEAGYTSHDVVARLRGILKQKKIGHTGTLDPEAVGLLVICLGNATRVAELLTDHDKEYIAVAELGVVTDTQDMTGTILERHSTREITREQLNEAVRAFQGTYEQLPPMYSAVRVNGKRLYTLAREGKTVERASRTVRIDSISLDDFHNQVKGEDYGIFTMHVRCSRGTYIRTLCHDIGQRLGCGAAMGMLVRTAVGNFRVEEALTLAQVEAARDDGTLVQHILPVEKLFGELDKVTVEEAYYARLTNGNGFGEEQIVNEAPEDENDVLTEQERNRDGERVRVYCDGKWFGIYKYSSALRQFRVERFFYEA